MGFQKNEVGEEIAFKTCMFYGLSMFNPIGASTALTTDALVHWRSE
jgi:hypothetical protein